MADQQDALAALSRFGAGMLGDQHAGALHLLHRDPLHLEAKVSEFSLHDLGDGADTLKVVGTAVDVDELFKHAIGCLLVGVDEAHHGLFLRRERRCVLGNRGNAGCSSQ